MMRWWRWHDDGDDDDCECVTRRYGCSLKGESSYRDPTPPAYHPLLLWIHLLQISSISSRHQFLNKKNSLWKDSSPCSALILKWCICWQTAGGALLFNISTLSMVFNHKLQRNKKPAPHLMCFMMDHQEITFHNLKYYLSLDWFDLSYPFSDCEIYPSEYSSEKEPKTQKPEWIDLLSKEWISITLKKRKRNMRARGSFSCEPRNFHVFPLDNSDIQKPSVNQRSIPFQNYHRIEKPAKCMMEKLTHRDSNSKLCC